MTRINVFAVAILASVALAQDTRVVLLGTGTPYPDPVRSGPAVALISGDNVYMVDAGPGVVRRAVQAGIKMRQLTRVFITHLHSDHTLGLPDLIFTPAVVGRHAGIAVYGPPGIGAMVANIRKAWTEDVDIRLNGLEQGDPAAYQVETNEVRPGEVYRDSTMRVTAFAVNHGSWKYAYGYRFEGGGKSIVVSGDTAYSESLIAAAKGCDILIHEVYSAKGLEKEPPGEQRYHPVFHTSGVNLGKLAAQVQPKKLVLYHQLLMRQTPEEVLHEVRENFHGEIIYGNDLDVIR